MDPIRRGLGGRQSTTHNGYRGLSHRISQREIYF
jgi:hypothetical protein